MLKAHRLLTHALLAGLAGVALASGCKKKDPPPPPPPPPAPPEVRLQVTSVSPSTVAPDAAISARIFGSAFENGASVSLTGPTSASGSEVRVSDSNTINLTLPALPVGSYDVTVTNPSGERATLRAGLTVRVMDIACRTSTVYFAYDVADLSSSARSTLDGNMACYKSLSGAIKVEGHADERGTTDYNLALGQRRADSVKRQLTSGGVAGSRVSTVSYGEERPVDRGSHEGAWSKNRRAEITASE